MCGIAGAVDVAVDLEAMAGAMAHRGPDGQATWRDERCGLAFRRLAIIDLDERSMQPMHHGPWHLVFNGEIYDYRERRDELRALGHEFVTDGDGEVLLHAWAQWGEEALDRINGMFAFAVWHDEREELTLATDPFGEKPLFWMREDDGLAFASDIRALPGARSEREAAVAPYLALGLLPPVHDSFFADVARLPAAHVLRLTRGEISLRRYWTPARIPVPSSHGEQAALLRELLTDSVRLRLRADVAVGTSLSGGVDSSAIVALVARLAGGQGRHAFTARFPGFARDEWGHAATVARHAHVGEHHAVEPTGAELLGDLDALVADQEEPVASSSIYAQWRVMRAAREAGVTVLLDGQGPDELLGGYPSLAGWAVRGRGPRAVAKALARGDGAVARALGADVLPHAARRAHRRRLATPYAAAGVADAAARCEPPALEPLEPDPFRRELLRQSFHTSLPGLLRYADRDSMAHSREVRLPFLDRRIAELCLSLPADAAYRDGVSKRVLRDAVRGLVPDAILDRRDKVGFETPQARWLAEPAFAAHIGEVLLDRSARSRGLLDTAILEADVRAGTWRDPAGVWRALNLELWLRAGARVPVTTGG